MKNLKFFTLAIAILGFTSVSFAQTPRVSATGEAFATIIAPITIENNAPLRFGNIIASTKDGKVTVSSEGVRTSDGGAYFPSVLGDVNAAEFTVTGLAGATYSITLPTAIKLQSKTSAMEVNEFKDNAKKVLAEGKETFQLGATLVVAANQEAGEYKGKFEVTVNYN